MKELFLITIALGLSSCCYCIIQVPDLYPIPEDWELEELTEECGTIEVSSKGK